MKAYRFKLKKLMACTAVSCTLAAPVPAFAYGCAPFSHEAMIATTMAMEAAIKTLWQMLFNNMSSVLLSFDRKELSSMKVLTRQIATAAKAEIKASEELSKGAMSALSYLETQKEQMRVFRNYGPMTGQGTDPCAQLSLQTKIQLAEATARNAARTMLQRAAAAPGRYGNRDAFMRNAQQVRERNFATKDDEVLGRGSATTDVVVTTDGKRIPLAGADTNAEVLFANSSDSRVALAKEAFINNILGAPDAPPSAQFLQTPAGQEYVASKARKDLLMSAAAHSLTTIAAENSPSSNGADSKMEALRKMRDSYFGEGATERWKAWMGQEQRGLMMDMMRMDAAMLASTTEQYKSGQRLELLLGGLVIDAGTKLSNELALQQQAITAGSLQSRIR